jgi:copper chaperone CopZ
MTTETKIFRVVGQQKMHCGGCENTVQFTLRQVPGVQQVEASHKTQLIKLRFDSQNVDLERIQQELDWIGYQVAEVRKV